MKLFSKVCAAIIVLSLLTPCAWAQIQPGGTNNVTIGAPVIGVCPDGYDLYNNAGVVGCQTDVGNGTVTSASVVTANGLAGTVANSTTTPAITLTTTVTGILQGNGTAISAATTSGTGAVALVNGATFIAPVLGTPASGVATNLTGTAAGLTAGSVTTNANLTGPITSSGNATAIASQTGTGTKFVVDTAPTLAGTVTFTGLILPASTSTPTCGTGCASISGNDQKFTVTTGTAQTSVTVTFGHTWTSSPVCSIGTNTTASVIDIASVSTGAITFGASLAITGSLIYVNCY